MYPDPINRPSQPRQKAKGLWIGVSGLVLLISLCWLGLLYKPGWKGSSEKPLLPLEVDLKSLYFGEVEESPSFPWALQLRNTSTSPVTISAITSNCSCIQALQEKVVIPAGESASLPLRMDLQRLNAGQASLLRDAKAVVYLQIDATRPFEFRCNIQGKIRRGIT